MASSTPHYLPRAPSANTITRRVRASTYKFGGWDTVYSKHYCRKTEAKWEQFYIGGGRALRALGEESGRTSEYFEYSIPKSMRSMSPLPSLTSWSVFGPHLAASHFQRAVPPKAWVPAKGTGRVLRSPFSYAAGCRAEFQHCTHPLSDSP